MTNPQAVEALEPCPFCGAGTTEIRPQKPTWNGGLKPPSEPISVSIWHWCEPVEGQPNRGFERIGRDETSAIAAWNQRATQPAPQPEAQALPSAEQIEKARKWDHIQPYLCKTCGGFGLVDRSTRDGPDAEPCPACNELSSPAPAPLSDEQIDALIPDATIKGLGGGFKFYTADDLRWFARAIERRHGIGLDGGM